MHNNIIIKRPISDEEKQKNLNNLIDFINSDTKPCIVRAAKGSGTFSHLELFRNKISNIDNYEFIRLSKDDVNNISKYVSKIVDRSFICISIDKDLNNTNIKNILNSLSDFKKVVIVSDYIPKPEYNPSNMLGILVIVVSIIGAVIIALAEL